MPNSNVVDNRNEVVNPYNFVPLGKSCKRTEKKNRIGEELSGKIVCEIIPKTDIFIANTSSDNAFHTYTSKEDEKERHKSYDFFSYTNLSQLEENKEAEKSRPVIPGSSIRGMIKNEYEALTNSCFMTNLNLELVRRQIIHKKTNRTPGILIGGGESEWKLYKAKRIKVPKYLFGNLKTGDIVKVKYSESDLKATQVTMAEMEKENFVESSINQELGIVLVGEKRINSNSNSVHIFILSDKSPITDKNIDNAVKRLRLIMKSYGKDRYKNYIISDTASELSFTPVWYYQRTISKTKNTTEETFYYFSPAAIGKDYYSNTISNIIKNHTNVHLKSDSFLPCSNENELCDACNLFGVVSDGNSKVMAASKVRFSDALLVGFSEKEDLVKLYTNPKTLKILSSPRPSCVEMYTYLENKPDHINYWDFEWAENIYIGNTIRLRGRKFYWHHTGALAYTTEEKNNMNITARVLRESAENKGDIKFQFEVYFEKISQQDLKRLIWILSLGGNNNTCYHKIGMGKPLGLGSNKIKVCNVLLRQLERKEEILYNPCYDATDQYKNYFNTEQIDNNLTIIQELEFDYDVYESFIKIMDSKSTKKLSVSYPTAKDKNGNETVYHWFGVNKARGEFENTLPNITSDKITLPIY